MIRVKRQPEPPPYENCCFCFTPTPFWYTPKDVACCPACAATHQPKDVPDKETWVRSVEEHERAG
jgi:hypothetical protein